MKKTFLAVALAAAFTTLTFAQATPPATQTPATQNSKKKVKKTSVKHAKKAKKDSQSK